MNPPTGERPGAAILQGLRGHQRRVDRRWCRQRGLKPKPPGGSLPIVPHVPVRYPHFSPHISYFSFWGLLWFVGSQIVEIGIWIWEECKWQTAKEKFLQKKKKWGQTELFPFVVLHRNLDSKENFLQISFHVFLWIKRCYSRNSYRNRNPILFLQNSYESKEV
jgi:hypothetical protein